jgi:hypothetical protein
MARQANTSIKMFAASRDVVCSVSINYFINFPTKNSRRYTSISLSHQVEFTWFELILHPNQGGLLERLFFSKNNYICDLPNEEQVGRTTARGRRGFWKNVTLDGHAQMANCGGRIL